MKSLVSLFKCTKFIILTGLFVLPVLAQTYIENVTIVDVESQKLIPAQTVVIKEDMIAEIASSGKIKPANQAKIINGSGKFLLAGMTDSHVHFFQSGGLYARPDAIDLRKYQPYQKEILQTQTSMEDFLRRYLKAGITTVIDVGATYNFLNKRQEFSDKDFAPKIYMTGPLLTTMIPPPFKDLKNDEPFKLVTNLDEVQKYINEQLQYKPDFIKVWYIVDQQNVEASAKKFEPVFKAIVEESHKNNLKVAVHATEKITAEIAVQNGADFLVHSVDDGIVSDEFVQMMKEKKTVICPTLTVYSGYSNTFGQKNNFSFYALTSANPFQIGSLDNLKHLPETALINQYKQIMNSPAFAERDKVQNTSMRTNLKKLSDAGVTVVAGTDAGNIGTQHAASFIGELRAMKESGLTNWQVLQSATINAAKLFSKNTGNVAVGKKADLILLDANPTENLDNLLKINMVFNRGKALNPNDLIIETRETLAQKQLNAYNVRNLEAFLEPYAEDVEIFNFPSESIMKGKEAMRKRYGELFANYPNLHCELKNRIVQGEVVIDQELVTGVGENPIKAIAIYHIKQGKIAKVTFIR